MFVGATALNMLAAVAVVAVVRRRTGPARALWAATWVCLLAGVLAAAGPSATTYSESTLGALISPWNPTVVIFPLLLFTVLCAAAVDRSPLSLLAALVVGSFIIQTDISVLPVVAALFVASAAACLAVRLSERRGGIGSERAPAPVPICDPYPAEGEADNAAGGGRARVGRLRADVNPAGGPAADQLPRQLHAPRAVLHRQPAGTVGPSGRFRASS